MTPQNLPWQACAHTVRGDSHQRQNKPNQDAYHLVSKAGNSIVITISDGHGSDRYFRSHVGAQLAVKVAAEVLQTIVSQSYETVYELSRQQLPAKLVQGWQKAVIEHYQTSPFTEEEKERLATNNNIIPYGATLLGVVVTPAFIVYLQLGDGDILCLNQDGTIFRPLAGDSRLFANETTSLCLSKAWSDFRIQMQPCNESSPVLIFLATDGYSNSFPSEEDLHNDMRLYLNWIKEEGLESVDRELPKLLEQVTKRGSGDDITVGIMTRLACEQKTAADKTSNSETSEKNDKKITEEQEGQDNRLDTLATMPITLILLIILLIIAFIIFKRQ